MPRYFLELSFKGTNYSGWQIQDNANAVQAEINKALTFLCAQPSECTGCGRTDKEYMQHSFLYTSIQQKLRTRNNFYFS